MSLQQKIIIFSLDTSMSSLDMIVARLDIMVSSLDTGILCRMLHFFLRGKPDNPDRDGKFPPACARAATPDVGHT